jgi:UDP-N-acetylmuramoyl-tripeptide--D-alanyl-D-alanine ligase
MEIEKLYALFLEHPVVTTDSRDCPADSIFFALKGDSFNGNAYATAALNKGCAFAVIDEMKYAVPGDARYLVVEDVLTTLQALAHYHREQLKTPIIEVTGTNGKTTTKELLAAVLKQKFRVHYTQGNFNNHIGVPKTLLQMTREHEIAVIETGANHPGEIKTLAEIVNPDYGLITNVGKAHLAGFGSFEGVINTKGELYDYLRTKKDATVFLSNDSPYLKPIAHHLKQVLYGAPTPAAKLAVEGEVVSNIPFLSFRWHAPEGAWHTVQTHLVGAYNIDNLLSAVTVGLYFGVAPEQIDAALSEYVPKNNRSQFTKTERNQLIVDAYNANPTSMMAALRNFREIKAPHKMVILGEMRELGDYSTEEHRKVVEFLQKSDCEQVWLVGESFKAVAPEAFRTFTDVEEVKEAIAKNPLRNLLILIKGSNGTKLFQLPELL